MTLRTEILTLFADPTNAYVVLIAGGILVTIEFGRPGRILPGVGGAVLIILGLHALAQRQWTIVGETCLLASVLFAIGNVARNSRVGHLLCSASWTVGSILLLPRGEGIHPAVALAGGAFAWSCSWLLSVAYRARLSKFADCHR
jgi:membrane-bound ClpP family serine protease